jgi:hypothetical protein
MTASLSFSPPLFIAAGAPDNSDDLATTIFVFLLVLTPFVLLTVALWSKRFTHSKAPVRTAPFGTRQANQPSGGKRAPIRAPQATGVARIVPAPPSRVISLHSTTPGQSPFEYNIGDNQGTRGSVRAA